MRIFLKSGLLLFAGAVLASCAGQQKGGMTAEEYLGYNPDEQQLQIGDDIAIAQTQYGKIKGYILHGVYTYLGVPYGASTEGENRFMPPQPCQPWDDILPTVFYGDTAPQNTKGKYTNSYSTFADHWNYWDVSEDCLKLNVWTPNTDNKKRPVLVWLHGGGYTSGSGIEQDGYNGENLAREGDVVFVTINHRLGAMGYTDFSAVDEKFKDSGNVGMLDIHAALQWVHDNIANFGGDPGNVTIMGQSGGGAKVCNMIAMSDNKGLVHKGVALSGNAYSAADQTYTSALGKYIFEKSGKTMKQLQEMPWEEYYAFANQCARDFAAEHPEAPVRGGFSPVADGVHFPKGTFYENPDDWSKDVAMMFCTTTAEWGRSRTDAKLEEIGKEEAIEMMKAPGLFGGPTKTTEQAAASYEAYAKVAELLGKKKPIDIVNLQGASRDRVVATADAKKKQAAPVYMALFDYQPHMFNERMRAFHCADICYWFKNTDKMITHTGGGKEPRVLSDKMSAALLNFMKTGNPNNSLLPEWPEYTPEQGALMLLNNECKVLNDPDREARAAGM